MKSMMFSLLLMLSLNVYAEPFYTFNEPKLDGYRIDWCLAWNDACGRPAADYYCRLKGFSKAREYTIAHNIGLTYVMRDKQVCRYSHCDGFKWIQCL